MSSLWNTLKKRVLRRAPITFPVNGLPVFLAPTALALLITACDGKSVAPQIQNESAGNEIQSVDQTTEQSNSVSSGLNTDVESGGEPSAPRFSYTQISDQYYPATGSYGDRDGEFTWNSLVATESDKWAGLWSFRKHGSQAREITAVTEIDGEWSSPVVLGSTYTVAYTDGNAIAASENHFMVAWSHRSEGNLNSEIRARVWQQGNWQAELTVSPPATEGQKVHSVTLTALPGDRFAIVWWDDEDNIYFSEWNGSQWSAPMFVAEGCYHRHSQLVANQRGDLTLLYCTQDTRYWLRDRLANVWQEPVEVSDPVPPIWLEKQIAEADQPQLATSSTDRQLLFWPAHFKDIYGLTYYGTSIQRRFAVDEVWSEPSLQLTGNYWRDDVQAAVKDNGAAVISWSQKVESSGDYTLAMARITPDGEWLSIDSDLLNPQNYPAWPANAEIELKNHSLQSVNDEILVVAAMKVYIPGGDINDIQNWFDQYDLMAASVGFEENSLNNIDHRLYTELNYFSCGNSTNKFRCSSTVPVRERWNGILSYFTNDQIGLVDIRQ